VFIVSFRVKIHPMKKIRWQILVICLTGLVVGFLLLAEQPVQNINPSAKTEIAPVTGGSYTEALVGSLQRLNPILDYFNAADRDVDRLIFSGLLRFDGTGTPQPDLAEKWGISKDGTVYNILLRKDAKWHDGKPITSSDVIFTIDLMRNGGTVVPEDLQQFWKNVEVVELDKNNLQFRLPEPFSPFLDYLTFGILPQHLLEGKTIEELIDDPLNLNPVGSGPYKFQEFLVEDDQIKGVVLAANQDYYIHPPYIEKITFRYYSTVNEAFQALTNGQVQGMGGVPAEFLPSLLKNSEMQVYTGRKPEMTLILLNLNNPEKAFLKELSVRKALMLGLNRQLMIDQLLGGQAVIADGPILPGTWAYHEGLESLAYDPETARTLLKEAGYVLSEGDTVRKKGDVALQVKLIYPDDEIHRKLAEAVQKDWNAIGVGVELEAISYEVLVNERLDQRVYEAAVVELNLARSPDPDPYPFWDQAMATSGQNYSQWDNQYASEYLEQARITTDISERSRLYHNFQVLFNQELPALTLYYPMYSYVLKKDILGVSMGPLFETSDRFATIIGWSFAGKKPVQPTLTNTPGN
jgi:peptide/nickel transport system substrate-binding protein